MLMILCYFYRDPTSNGARNFERREDNVMAPVVFIAKAHNEQYAFYTRKGDLLKENSGPNHGNSKGGSDSDDNSYINNPSFFP